MKAVVDVQNVWENFNVEILSNLELWRALLQNISLRIS